MTFTDLSGVFWANRSSPLTPRHHLHCFVRNNDARAVQSVWTFRYLCGKNTFFCVSRRHTLAKHVYAQCERGVGGRFNILQTDYVKRVELHYRHRKMHSATIVCRSCIPTVKTKVDNFKYNFCVFRMGRNRM